MQRACDRLTGLPAAASGADDAAAALESASSLIS